MRSILPTASPDPAMSKPVPLFARLSDAILSFYGRRLPYHPGKWRITAALEKGARDSWTSPRTARCHGIWYELDLRDFVARNIFLNTYDNWEVRFVRRMLSPGSIVVDVGANIGFYSLICSKLIGEAGRVYAFEPATAAADQLVRNIRLNGAQNITLIRSALGSHCGTAAMLSASGTNTGKTQIAASFGAGSQQVPITTLDSFVDQRELTSLDFLKVDIEGFEMEFLTGAKHSIGRFRPVILIELNPKALGSYGITPDAVIDTLKSASYNLLMPSWRGLKRFSSYPAGREFCNVFAVPA